MESEPQAPWYQVVKRAGTDSLVTDETLTWDWQGAGNAPATAYQVPLRSTLSAAGAIDQQ